MCTFCVNIPRDHTAVYLCFLKKWNAWSLGKFFLLSVSAWKDTPPIGDPGWHTDTWNNIIFHIILQLHTAFEGFKTVNSKLTFVRPNRVPILQSWHSQQFVRSNRVPILQSWHSQQFVRPNRVPALQSWHSQQFVRPNRVPTLQSWHSQQFVRPNRVPTLQSWHSQHFHTWSKPI